MSKGIERKSFRIPSIERLEKKCADWNASNPIGTPVDYFPVIGGSVSRTTKTRSAAFVLSGHTAVVFVEQVAGCVDLDAVKVKVAA